MYFQKWYFIYLFLGGFTTTAIFYVNWLITAWFEMRWEKAHWQTTLIIKFISINHMRSRDQRRLSRRGGLGILSEERALMKGLG